jgi:uncharacterized protein (TIGR02996 family)
MSVQIAFLQAIADAPDDDEVRLAFADWFEESLRDRFGDVA